MLGDCCRVPFVNQANLCISGFLKSFPGGPIQRFYLALDRVLLLLQAVLLLFRTGPVLDAVEGGAGRYPGWAFY